MATLSNALSGFACLSDAAYTRTFTVNLYCAFIYPFLIYGLTSWGNTYSSTISPLRLVILQKQAIRIMTYSKFDEHSSPIFKSLNIVKLPDLVFPKLCINFRVDVYLLFLILSLHKSTKDTATVQHKKCFKKLMIYTLPKVRKNYGLFNIRFKGPKIWNPVRESTKTLSLSKFKDSIKLDLILDYRY